LKLKKRLLTLVDVLLIVVTWAIFLVINPILISADIVSLSESANPEVLKEHILQITGTEKARNYKNMDALNQTADYIKAQFEANGLVVSDNGYPNGGTTYRNISGIYGDPNLPRVVVGAHYDVHNKSVGADDNASGIAALLELGRMLQTTGVELDYAIEFVAYPLEEEPFFKTEYMGSAVHAKKLKENGTEVLAMLCFDMIGYYDDQPGSQSYPFFLFDWIYPSEGDYIMVIGKFGASGLTKSVKKGMHAVEGLDTWSLNGFSFIEGIDNSDHYNYWENGFDAVLITNTGFYRNPNYHKVGDTPETLNYPYMAKVVDGVYSAITTSF